MDAIASKADVTGCEGFSSSSSQSFRQVHLHLEQYLLQSEWDAFTSVTLSHDNKVMCMGKAMERLYLLHPSETTAASAVAIALSADGPHPLDFSLQKLRQLKHYLALCLKSSQKATSLPESFPERVADFAKEHPTFYAAAFAHGEPIPCPVDRRKLMYMKANVPCRSSRSGCGYSLPEHHKSVRGSVACVQAAVGMGSRPSFGDLPGFQWANPQMQRLDLHPGRPRQHPYEAAAAQHAVPLALMDMPSAQQPLALPPQLQPLALPPQQQSLAPQPPSAAQGAGDGSTATVGTAPSDAPAVSVSDLVSKWQQKAREVKSAAADDSDGARKRPSAAIPCKKQQKKKTGGQKKTAKAGKNKQQKEKTAGQKKAAKAGTGGKKKATANTSGEFDTLTFKYGPSLPRYYGSVTVYTDKKKEEWRVKPCPGSRETKKITWKGLDLADAKRKWSFAVDYVKSIKQV